MERELLLTGIGGQGIQLAAQVVSLAALAEGREVQLFGSYGGMMRGGNTEATVVIADEAIAAPPTVSSAWSVVLMHHDYSEPTLATMRPGTLVLVNSTVFTKAFDRAGLHVLDVPATDIAIELGNMLAATMVMTGVYSAVTELVHIDSLCAAVAEALPSYRAKHIDMNVAALRAGYEQAPALRMPAWQSDAAEAVR